MTEWVPANMTKNSCGKYEFKCTLARGLKYRYWFLVDGQKVLDQASEISMNRVNQPTNFINVPNSDDCTSAQLKLEKHDTYQEANVPDAMLVKYINETKFKNHQELCELITANEALVWALREYQASIEVALHNRDKFEEERLRTLQKLTMSDYQKIG